MADPEKTTGRILIAEAWEVGWMMRTDKHRGCCKPWEGKGWRAGLLEEGTSSLPSLLLSLPPLLSRYFEDKETTEQRNLKLKGREWVIDKAKFKGRARSRIRSRGGEISAKRRDIFCDISVVVAGVGRWGRGRLGTWFLGSGRQAT